MPVDIAIFMNLFSLVFRTVGLVSGASAMLCSLTLSAVAIPVNGPQFNTAGCQSKSQCAGVAAGADVVERYGGRLPAQNRSSDDSFSMTAGQVDAQKPRAQ